MRIYSKQWLYLIFRKHLFLPFINDFTLMCAWSGRQDVVRVKWKGCSWNCYNWIRRIYKEITIIEKANWIISYSLVFILPNYSSFDFLFFSLFVKDKMSFTVYSLFLLDNTFHLTLTFIIWIMCKISCFWCW